MFGRSVFCLLTVSLVTLSPPSLGGQAESSRESLRIAPDFSSWPPTKPQPPTEPVTHNPRFPVGVSHPFGFPQFARAAGMIFSGTVTNIERRPANLGQSVETVAITFHVESAIRGTKSGEDLTISQWIGVWSSGQRYRVRERVFLFLYPVSKLGLTSCVGGQIGRFTIDPRGRVLLTPQHLSAFRADPVLGGRSRVSLSDFASAVRRAGEEE